MCTWARVGSHRHETDLCRMEDRSWWCWNAVCAILTFYFCLDYLSGNSCLASVSSYLSFCKSESVLSMQSGFTPMNLWEDCAVLCHWSHSSTLSTMKIQSPMSLWHHLPLECSCVVTFSAHGTCQELDGSWGLGVSKVKGSVEARFQWCRDQGF